MEIKEKLFAQCRSIIKEKVDNAQTSMDASHESMLGETKSSAGDKFETSRAMLQAEQDRMKSVIIKNKELEYKLSQITKENTETVKPGAVVYTSGINYFISVGLGKLLVEGQTFYAISPEAPIGRQLMGKRAGDTFEVNGKESMCFSLY